MKLILQELTKNISLRQLVILTHLKTNGGKIRSELVKELNMPRTTIFNNLERLEKKKLVFRIDVHFGEVGRPVRFWQAKQAHNLVLFFKLIINKKPMIKNNKTKKKDKIIIESSEINKIPTWIKKDLLIEVKSITYNLKKLEYINKKPKRSLDSNFSYILYSKEQDLIDYALKEINNRSFFRIHSLSKQYVNKTLCLNYDNNKQDTMHGISVKLGRIVGELNRLGLIIKHTNAARTLWRNLYKDDLQFMFNKKMKEKYPTLNLKELNK